MGERLQEACSQVTPLFEAKVSCLEPAIEWIPPDKTIECPKPIASIPSASLSHLTANNGGAAVVR